MTNKEQIIIDDIDVSECENFRPKNRFTCYPHICNCHQKPNCYFKQLARKTQEYETLKSESFTREELISLQENDINCYRKALKKIEEIVELSYRPYTVCGEYNESYIVLSNILNVIKEIKEQYEE